MNDNVLSHSLSSDIAFLSLSLFISFIGQTQPMAAGAANFASNFFNSHRGLDPLGFP
jgi:hypothetical protein